MHTPIVGILRQKISGMSANDYASILRNKHGITNIKIAETPDERGELLTSASIITGDLIQEKDIDKAENLDLFACVNAGTGHLPLEMLSEHDIAVTNASGVHAPNIAEHVLGAILIHVHDFRQAWQQQQSGLWASYPVSKLQESTVTVVGLGAIGNAVINRLDPFDVDTIGIRYSPKKGGLTDEILGFEDIDDALARTDYLILACPLTETTRGIIDSDALLTLPSDAFIVNISRGSVIETNSLIETLHSDQIGGAVLDVTDPEPLLKSNPLWSFDNVLITPHNAGYTPHYYKRTAKILAENIKRYKGSDQDFKNRVL